MMEKALAEKHACEDALTLFRSAEKLDKEARDEGQSSKHPFGG